MRVSRTVVVRILELLQKEGTVAMRETSPAERYVLEALTARERVEAFHERDGSPGRPPLLYRLIQPLRDLDYEADLTHMILLMRRVTQEEVSIAQTVEVDRTLGPVNITSTTFERDLRHLERKILGAGPNGIRRTRLLRWRRKAELDPLLAHLLKEERVQKVRVPTQGRDLTVYVATRMTELQQAADDADAAADRAAMQRLGRKPSGGSSSPLGEEEAPPAPVPGSDEDWKDDSSWGPSRRPEPQDVTVVGLFGKEPEPGA